MTRVHDDDTNIMNTVLKVCASAFGVDHSQHMAEMLIINVFDAAWICLCDAYRIDDAFGHDDGVNQTPVMLALAALKVICW